MSRKRKKNDSEEEGVDPNGWMVTFSDLLTLLLTFFVLLLTMSSMDTKSLQSMFAAFLGSADVMEFSTQGAVEPYSFVTGYINPFELLKVLERLLQSYKEEPDYDLRRGAISVTSSKQSVFVTFPGSILFESGGVDIREESLPVLKELTKVMKRTDYMIRVEGHTDDISFQGGRYSSNWQVSAMRSINVFRYFLNEGLPPERLTAVGYGEYKPVFRNDTEEHRRKNRRVELILERVIDKGR